MSQSLQQVAETLVNKDRKVQLIYAFNGTGKTRLSREFKKIVSPEKNYESDVNEQELSRNKIIYYSAFTEDLFYWDNNLDEDSNYKLKIQRNTFTGWLISLLQELGEDGNIAVNFQRYTGSKATPTFNPEYKVNDIDHAGREVSITIPAFTEVTFQVTKSNPITHEDTRLITEENITLAQGQYDYIKISKGEESNFIWCVIYTLLEQVVSILSEPDISSRITDKFNQLEYIFIDDPVSSLDDSHLIQLAIDLASLIKSPIPNLKFVITTHNPLFYNVMYNELNNKSYKKNTSGDDIISYNPKKSFLKYRLKKNKDGLYNIIEQKNDSPFSYHLFLLHEVQRAIKENKVRKYHFGFMRNILEKMATFLGYKHWSDLLPKTSEDKPEPFFKRILNLSSHSAHSGEEITDINDEDIDDLARLVSILITKYGFSQKEENNG